MTPATRTPRRTTPRTPARRPRHKATPKKRRLSWRGRMVVGAGGLVMALVIWAVLARHFAPQSNTQLERFDAIIVLGSPADSDGNPTPGMLARVNEGVREYERDVAPRMILTGGAAHNQFVEAQVMARAAEAQGIPASAIFIEPQARDTIQNACYAVRMMKEHGWHSAEVVSSANHLPRAELIFSRLPVLWRVHAAPPVEPESAGDRMAMGVLETLKTVHYLIYSRWTERCEP